MRTLRVNGTERARQLQEAELFRGIPAAPLQPLADVTLLRAYDAGECLFLQDEEANGFFVLRSGMVHVFRTGMDGRRQILHLFDSPGDVCGEVPVFEGGTYPAGAETLEASTLLYVPRQDFLRVTRQHPELLLSMLAVLSKRLRRFVGLIDDLSLKDVGTRLAQYLLEASEKEGASRFRLGMTKTLLASRLGTIAETVSRTLRKMQEQGLIIVNGREITIRDLGALTQVAEGEDSL